MRFLVTGSTGFVGPHLMNLLINEGHEVFGMFRNQYEDTIDVLKENYKYVRWVKGDITDYESLKSILRKHKYEGCFHLASMTHPATSFNQPVMTFQQNAVGTINLVEAIINYNPFCVLHNCSTSEVYGVTKTKVTEFHPRNPNNPYSVSKHSAELYVTEQAKEGKLMAYSSRAFSHTGPRRSPKYSIASDAVQIAKIILEKQENEIRIGNMSAIRNVADVRDIVDVYYQLMTKAVNQEIPNGEIYNVCGNELHTIMYYLEIMLGIANIDPKLTVDPSLYRKVEIQMQDPDSTKVRRLLGWEPKIPLKQTLTDLLNYWLEKVNNEM